MSVIVCGSQTPEQKALSTLQKNGFSISTKQATPIYSDSTTKGGLCTSPMKMKHLSYENKLRKFGFFSLKKEKVLGRFQYLIGAYIKKGLFIQADSDRTRVNGFKLKERRFRLDVGKKLFTVKVVRPGSGSQEKL